MEINFSKNGGSLEVLKFGSLEPSNLQTSNSPTRRPSSTLMITRATVSAEDIAAAEIPDAALARDDALGKLVGKAFNLPPPPMPSFGSLQAAISAKDNDRQWTTSNS